MCDICHRTPCDPRCPNAEDAATVYDCEYCGEPIRVGDLYREYDGKYYHDDCFPQAAVNIVVKENGFMRNTPTDKETQVGVCSICGEPVLEYEDYWKNETKMCHCECLSDNAADSLKTVALYATNDY